ncbi:DHRS-12_like_SDR_c-like domain-containing protein isoform X2 [Hoplias malabaricus]|uniref:DHRS-12_like_SDR_c-like domain-containing protein isoform X2 n=1 Tax=Hoplias malabaricus TaxID=27720 RepID=UPI00346220AD
MSLYRNSAWFLKGLTEFTKGGFNVASKSFSEKDIEVSVAGRSFMITGANSGIGKSTALAIAKKGGLIHMVCRNKDKAEEARAEIVKESGNKEIYVHILDLSETKKVWEFAEAFKKKYKTLSVLINNAGCMMTKREVNAEGLEKSFAVNSLAMYILIKSLIPLLEKSPDPRVITVTSGGMLVQKLRAGNLQSQRGRYDGTMVYAQNKGRGGSRAYLESSGARREYTLEGTPVLHRATQTFTHTYGHFRVTNPPATCVFGLWEETGAPGGNPRGHGGSWTIFTDFHEL